MEWFTVENKLFVHEDGEFELVVDRSAKAWVEVATRQYAFHRVPLPQPGKLLQIHMPVGAIRALCPDPPTLTDSTGQEFAGRKSAEGEYLFPGLADGLYILRAPGFGAREVRPGDTVTMQRAEPGALEVWLPDGFPEEVHRSRFWETEEPRVELGGPWSLSFESARIKNGATTVVDLRGGGDVTVRSKPGVHLFLYRRTGAYAYTVTAKTDATGTAHLESVPPGRYTLEASRHPTMTAIVVGSDPIVVDLNRGHDFSGQVQLSDDGAAQGARVELWSLGQKLNDVATDLGGVFRLRSLQPGVYRCHVLHPGYAPATATLTVDETGATSDDLPLRLVQATDAQLRVTGLRGEPLAGIEITINGRGTRTNALGLAQLGRLPARVDLELDGYATLRNRRIDRPGELKLSRAAQLHIEVGDSAEGVELRVGGRSWPLPRAFDGVIRLRDLPAGPVEVVRGDDRIETTLKASERTTVDMTPDEREESSDEDK